MFSFVFPVNFSTSEKSQAAWSNSFYIYGNGKYTLQTFEFIFIFFILFFSLYLSKKEEILKPETMNKCATINMFLIFVVIISIVHLSESIAIREAGGPPHWNAIQRSHGFKEKNDNDENTYGDKTDSAPPRKRNYEPCACPRIYWPVCGSDRMTYSNECDLKCAQKQAYGRSCNLRSLGDGTCDEFDFSSKA